MEGSHLSMYVLAIAHSNFVLVNTCLFFIIFRKGYHARSYGYEAIHGVQLRKLSTALVGPGQTFT